MNRRPNDVMFSVKGVAAILPKTPRKFESTLTRRASEGRRPRPLALSVGLVNFRARDNDWLSWKGVGAARMSALDRDKKALAT